MTDAPKKIWATTAMELDGSKWQDDTGAEYHLARPGQPFSTDEFLERLEAAEWWADDMREAMRQWMDGDFTAAMEGLE